MAKLTPEVAKNFDATSQNPKDRPSEHNAQNQTALNASSNAELIKKLPQGKYVTLKADLIAGCLQARGLSSGVAFYWRYTFANKTERDLIGYYDPSCPPASREKSSTGGWSINAAKVEASRRAHFHIETLNEGGYPAKIREQKDAAKRALPAQTHTLRDLLEHYVSSLQANNQSSWRDVKSSLDKHVLTPWKELAALDAKLVTTKDLVNVLRAVHQEGTPRQANKVRSYLHTAYASVMRSENDPTKAEGLSGYGILINPVAAIPANTHLNRPNKNPLNHQELKLYWKLLKEVEGIRGHALRLHLLSAAPRIAQFVRLKSEDITDDAYSLWDKKGRNGSKQPREYVIPITGPMAAIFKNTRIGSDFALSTGNGTTPIANTTLSNWASEIVGEKISNFQLRRVRSAVETILAKHNVSPEVRGRLQSHGITGIQDKHYNAYDYYSQKKDALELLYRILEM